MYKSLKFYIVSVNFDGRKEKKKKKKRKCRLQQIAPPLTTCIAALPKT